MTRRDARVGFVACVAVIVLGTTACGSSFSDRIAQGLPTTTVGEGTADTLAALVPDTAIDNTATDTATDETGSDTLGTETGPNTRDGSSGDAVAPLSDEDDESIIDDIDALSDALLGQDAETAYRALPRRCRADATPDRFAADLLAASQSIGDAFDDLRRSETSTSGSGDRVDAEVVLAVASGGGFYRGTSVWILEDAWRVDSCEVSEILAAGGLGPREGLPPVEAADIDEGDGFEDAVAGAGDEISIAAEVFGKTGTIAFLPERIVRVKSPVPLPDGTSVGGVRVAQTAGEFLVVIGEATTTADEPLDTFFALSQAYLGDRDAVYGVVGYQEYVITAAGVENPDELSSGTVTIAFAFAVPAGFRPTVMVGSGKFDSAPFVAASVAELDIE